MAITIRKEFEIFAKLRDDIIIQQAAKLKSGKHTHGKSGHNTPSIGDFVMWRSKKHNTTKYGVVSSLDGHMAEVRTREGNRNIHSTRLVPLALATSKYTKTDSLRSTEQPA